MAGEWFCGVSGDFGAGWVRSGAGITFVGVAGELLEEFEDGDPTHTQNLESRSHRPRALCVSGCGGGAPYPIGGVDLSGTARAHPRVYAKIFSEGMMRLLRVLEQFGGMQKNIPEGMMRLLRVLEQLGTACVCGFF